MNVRSCFIILAIALVGCASTGPKIHTDYDRTTNFATYRTFGFPAETGTDRGGYSTLTTSYFKDAVRKQMESRGYAYSAQSPDLLVNFYTNVRERTEVRSDPAFMPAWGYYGYRYGLYTGWPRYRGDIDTRTYKVGTANVDIVDAQRKQLIWEGVAEGTVTQDAMKNPRQAIDDVVAQLFTKYPGKPNL
jgi:hypothetical protein